MEEKIVEFRDHKIRLTQSDVTPKTEYIREYMLWYNRLWRWVEFYILRKQG